jgi:transposase-like protein
MRVPSRTLVHKIANALDKLPKSMQPKAKSKLHEAMNAPTRAACDERAHGV